jgi:glycosyltransferase involved in cell wall biosynthesis/GT2 family glycosyltransferase
MDPRTDAASTPTVSVVVCAFTADRWDALSAALASIARQSVPVDETILVIDHNAMLLERARRQWAPDVLVVANDGARGLSDARNTGLRLASGEVVAFLDDDAVAADDWLENLLRGYDDPTVAGVGGLVRPTWLAGRPRWFPSEFDWVVGCAHAGMPAQPSAVRNVIGAGMSFRRSALVALGGFRPELGRVGTTPVGCEETDLCIRARARGDTILYDPGAVVDHQVPPSRATFGYFLSRCRAEGRSKAVLSSLVGTDVGLSDERAYVRRALTSGVARNVGEAVRGDPGALARAVAIVAGLFATAAGFVAGRVRRSPAATSRRPGPLRVLVVTPRFPPDIGGVERHVHEVTRRLAARGCDVTVLCTDRTRKLPPTETIDGVTVRRVAAWPRRRDLYFAPRIWTAMGEDAWDLVHVQSYHTLVAPLAMWRARRLGVPYVVTFHGGGHSSRLRRAVRGTQRRALAPLVRGAARLIAVARFEVPWYSAEFDVDPDRFALIPNGTEPPAAVADRPPDGAVVASIGRLERYKGHHRAVAAFAHVSRVRPDARLWIVGTGPAEAALRRQVADLGLGGCVVFRSTPIGDPEAMTSLLASTRAVVCLSDFETHPLAALEAIAARRPVLVTATSGLRELADEGLAHAVPADAGDTTIAAAIVALLDADPPPAVDLSTWDDCATALLALYRDVACAS